jgi:hypothetical protein
MEGSGSRNATKLERSWGDRTPIFFVSCDSVGDALTLHANSGSSGSSCVRAFPAVPVNRPGVRCTVGLHNELEDMDALIAAARQVIPETPSPARTESILLA